MTREEAYLECLIGLEKSDFLILEACTGYGKTKMSINLVNHLVEFDYHGKHTSMLLLVAKTVHKQTWKDEFKKWGGINVDEITIECYESLKKHEKESFDFVIMDECHHLNSDKRIDIFNTIKYTKCIALSATVPRLFKWYLKSCYKAAVVTCSIADAIKDEVLPEPKIILYPLQLDNNRPTESIEVNPRAKGKTYYGNYNELWKYRKMKVHAIISCTPRQKVNEYNSLILYERNRYMRTRQEFLKNKWLFDCGERIKYLANLKNNIVLSILQRLEKERTITFCKTIEQADILGKYSIHSKNKDSDIIYNNFNAKKINHITSVNVLNEGANLVDCKYAVFANYSSSEICSVQRCGRALRHKSPVIILPYYESTREEEIVQEMIKDFNKDSIKTVHSLKELDKFI